MTMESKFELQYDENGDLILLRNKGDVWQMNWVEGQVPWGTTTAPKGIEVTKERGVTLEGNYRESYVFENCTEFPVYFKETDLGIAVALPDSYVDADECMKRHCHAHIWCGGEVSYIKAVRMSGIGPHLGMVLKEGSLDGYSIQRDVKKSSNDRGDFILHPKLDVLQPKERYEICMEWFWFESKRDFEAGLKEEHGLPVVEMGQCTYFLGEEISFHIRGKGRINSIEISCGNGGRLDWQAEEKSEEEKSGEEKLEEEKPEREKSGEEKPKREKSEEGKLEKEKPQGYDIAVTGRMEFVGEEKVNIEINGRKTYALLYGAPPFETLLENRCRFIAERQQETEGILDGAYLIYDRETQKRYYSHLNDHNGGRERVAMGTLLAAWLQEHEDKEIENSLNRYTAYVYRELFNENTGDVYNDAGRNADWDRLYNYPWMSCFLMELYRWKKEKKYILDSYKALRRYYEKDGGSFYGIGISACELIHLLEEAGLGREAEDMKDLFLRHAERIKETGLHFPKSEVNYEQSIAAPAVSVLLQAYVITGEDGFMQAAEEMMKVLELFADNQPDYHLFENAVRHWDGYWFGKRRRYGDTFPHYWSSLNAGCYYLYGKIRGEKEYFRKAKASLRGCLNLFDLTGEASCAMVYPRSINGQKGHYYDPWANDQDWALYFMWKMRGIVTGN